MRTRLFTLLAATSLATPAFALNAPVDPSLILDREQGGHAWCADDLAISAHLWTSQEVIAPWIEGHGPGEEYAGNTTGEWMRWRLKAHGVVTVAAIDILKNDGLVGAAGMFSDPANLQELLNGLREEDYGGVLDDIHGLKFDSHSHSHFYDYTRDSAMAAVLGRGLVIDKGPGGLALKHLCEPDPVDEFFISFVLTLAVPFPPELVSMVSTALQEGKQDWSYCSLVGPHLDAASLADIHYARAVEHMRKGNTAMAMRYLGRAIHLVQDTTAVPQHATNMPGTADSEHRPFESKMDQLLAQGFTAQGPFPHATTGGLYKSGVATYDDRRGDQLMKGYLPSDYVKHGAQKSFGWLGAASSGNWGQAAAAAVALIPEAERLTAGLLRRFHDNWKYEDFAVTILNIEKVEDLDDSADFSDSADMFVDIETSTPNTAHAPDTFTEYVRRVGMYMQETQAAAPNWPNVGNYKPGGSKGFSPTTWMFPKWHYQQNFEAGYSVVLKDDDGGWPYDGEVMDLSPKAGTLGLYFKYDSTGLVHSTDGSWQTQGLPDRTFFIVDGNGDGDHVRGRLYATMERIPTTRINEPDNVITLPVPQQSLDVCVPVLPRYKAAYLAIVFGDAPDGPYGPDFPGDLFTGKKENGLVWVWMSGAWHLVECQPLPFLEALEEAPSYMDGTIRPKASVIFGHISGAFPLPLPPPPRGPVVHGYPELDMSQELLFQQETPVVEPQAPRR